MRLPALLASMTTYVTHSALIISRDPAAPRIRANRRAYRFATATSRFSIVVTIGSGNDCAYTRARILDRARTRQQTCKKRQQLDSFAQIVRHRSRTIANTA